MPRPSTTNAQRRGTRAHIRFKTAADECVQRPCNAHLSVPLGAEAPIRISLGDLGRPSLLVLFVRCVAKQADHLHGIGIDSAAWKTPWQVSRCIRFGHTRLVVDTAARYYPGDERGVADFFPRCEGRHLAVRMIDKALREMVQPWPVTCGDHHALLIREPGNKHKVVARCLGNEDISQRPCSGARGGDAQQPSDHQFGPMRWLLQDRRTYGHRATPETLSLRVFGLGLCLGLFQFFTALLDPAICRIESGVERKGGPSLRGKPCRFGREAGVWRLFLLRLTLRGFFVRLAQLDHRRVGESLLSLYGCRFLACLNHGSALSASKALMRYR